MRRILSEACLAVAWVLFRTGPPRDVEENLRAVRWTVAVCHGVAAAGFLVHALATGRILPAASGGFVVALSGTALVRRYRRLASSLREEAVREVLES